MTTLKPRGGEPRADDTATPPRYDLRWAAPPALLAVGTFLAAAGNTGPAPLVVLAVAGLALAALAVTAPVRPGAFRRRSTPIAILGAAPAPSQAGAGDGPHLGSAR